MTHYWAWFITLSLQFSFLMTGPPPTAVPTVPPRSVTSDALALLDYIDRRAEAGDFAAFMHALERVPALFPVQEREAALYALARTYEAISEMKLRATHPEAPDALRAPFWDVTIVSSPSSSGIPSARYLAMFLSDRDPGLPAQALKYVDYFLFGDQEDLDVFRPRTDVQLLSLFYPEHRRQSHEEIVGDLGPIWDAPEASHRTNTVLARLTPMLPHQFELDVMVHLLDNEQLCQAMVTPHGDIYVTRALYEQAEADDALAFVLAHELAHLVNGDHDPSWSERIVSGWRTFMDVLLGRGRARAGADSGRKAHFGMHRSLGDELNADETAFRLMRSAHYSLQAVPPILSACPPPADEYDARLQAFERFVEEIADDLVVATYGLVPGMSGEEEEKLLTLAHRTYILTVLGDEDEVSDFIHPDALGIVNRGTFIASLLGIDFAGLARESLDSIDPDVSLYTLAAVQKWVPPYAKVIVKLLGRFDHSGITLTTLPMAVYAMQLPSGEWKVFGFDVDFPMDLGAQRPFVLDRWDREMAWSPEPTPEQVQPAPISGSHATVEFFLSALFRSADFDLVAEYVSEDLAEAFHPFHQQWQAIRDGMIDESRAMMDRFVSGIGDIHAMVGRHGETFDAVMPDIPPLDFKVSFVDVEERRGADTVVVDGTVKIELVLAGHASEPMYLPATFVLVPDDTVVFGFRITAIH